MERVKAGMKTENASGKNKRKKKNTVKSQEIKNKAYNSFDCLGEISPLSYCE